MGFGGKGLYETRADKQSECWVQTEQNNVRPLPVTEFEFTCTRLRMAGVRRRHMICYTGCVTSSKVVW